MREIFISILIIITIITFGIVVQNHLEKTSGELINDLQELKQELIQTKENKNMYKAKEKLEKTINHWENNKKIWSTIIMHEELDNIEVSLLALKANVENEKLEEALVELEKSIFWIGHIMEKEDLKLKNIF